jgi:hypothetical protein
MLAEIKTIVEIITGTIIIAVVIYLRISDKKKSRKPWRTIKNAPHKGTLKKSVVKKAVKEAIAAGRNRRKKRIN